MAWACNYERAFIHSNNNYSFAGRHEVSVDEDWSVGAGAPYSSFRNTRLVRPHQEQKEDGLKAYIKHRMPQTGSFCLRASNVAFSSNSSSNSNRGGKVTWKQPTSLSIPTAISWRQRQLRISIYPKITVERTTKIHQHVLAVKTK